MKNIKRLLAGLCAFAVVLCGAAALPESMTRLGASIETNAETSGDYEYKVLDDGTVEVTGYNGDETKVTVPPEIDGKKVTGIGASAFSGCTRLTDITVPDTVTSIGSCAFEKCTSLTGITVPDSVTSISDNMLYYCTSLKTVNIPDSVTEIGEYAFADCYSLESITIPNSVTSIGESAFWRCIKLAEVTIPGTVETIGAWAFDECESLKGITLPRNIESIGNHAFGYYSDYEADENKKVEGFTVYGYKDTPAETYASENGFAFVDLNKEYTDGDWTYAPVEDGIEIRKYTGTDTAVTVPAELDGRTVTSLGNGVFAPWNYKGGMTEVHLPSGLKNIGAQAFSNLETLETVDIPEGVESIGGSAFWCCTKLKKIKLPDSVTYLGAGAFAGCSALEEITLSKNITSLTTFGFDAYWYGTFEGCSMLKSIVIPKAVTAIDDYAAGYIRVFIDGDVSEIEKVPGFKIFCYKDTAGHRYAADNGFDYELLADTVPGDADGSGETNMQDYGLLQRWLAKWGVTINEEACDLNGDGVVNMQDYGLMQRMLAGWDITA